MSEAIDWKALIGFSSFVRRGPLVVVSCTAPLGPDGLAVSPGDTYAQAKRCLERVEGFLAEAGASVEDVVRTGLYISREAEWEAVGRAHGEVFGEVRPACTMNYTDLIEPSYLVEVDAMAWVEP